MDEKAGYRGYDLWIQKGAIGTHLINTWQDNAVKVVAKNPLKKDTWQHVAMVYDGSGKETGVKLYVDGVVEPHNVEANNLTATIKTGVPFRIGGRYGNAKGKGEVSDIRLFDRALSPSEVASLKDSGDVLSGLLAMPPEKLTEAHKRAITDAYLVSTKDVPFAELVAARAAVDAEVAKVEGARKKVNTMIMGDRPEANRRVTYILDRGQYDLPLKDQPVEPGVPAALPPLPKDAPPNRLGMAQWLVSKDHPLTARVAVNRYWAMLFGPWAGGVGDGFREPGRGAEPPGAAGLAGGGFCGERVGYQALDTADGDLGDLPAWPRGFRRICGSATRRTGWLARGSRFRLQGEFIRDGALAVSGLLVEEIGGPLGEALPADGDLE